MPKTRGTGLLMLWTDVDPEHEAEFNRWYNEEHIQYLLKVPGFLSAGRYEALSGGPKYLAMYELEEPSVLRTQAFLDEATASLDEPSEAALYKLLAEKLPQTTVVSIGHRSTLDAFHQRNIALARDGDRFVLRDAAKVAAPS